MKDGILVIDKPNGITSHDVIVQLRRRLKMKRIGHAGTLDPLATGVLVVLLGKCTKLSNQFSATDKAYRATLILGTSTTTADIQGDILKKLPYEHITAEQVQSALEKFKGEIDQVPPMVSAVKFKGERLYKLARRGIHVEREPRKIVITRLELEKFNSPYVSFYVECSKGTYVRQLAEDIGNVLGCGACISQIQRTKVGKISIEEAISLEAVNESHIRNWNN